jgi:hypothetical protein
MIGMVATRDYPWIPATVSRFAQTFESKQKNNNKGRNAITSGFLGSLKENL